MSKNDIANMSSTQKLELMEQIWDSFVEKDKEIESPLWHKEELENRAALLSNSKEHFAPLNEVKKRLQASLDAN